MKSFTTIAFIATSLLTVVSADLFANFFSDEACNVDGSIGFDMTNPGCFVQRSRKSVYIPNSGFVNDQFCLVQTYGDDHCGCQTKGYDFTSTGFCAVLDGEAVSYRFIGGSCGVNTC
ncbi:uncharacterized protein L201_007535 [Kwoniella dendrophila CBS 6074]|uniref:Uncharacterized protein n=1 Tax=Kwoniella dendrophila CBS 6074 TaxID=1295534 RepID=A0AAX4K4C2_9TREE